MRVLNFFFITLIINGGVFGMPKPKTCTHKFLFVTRAEWEAVPSNDTESLDIPVPYVVIHHTYIPGACYTTEQCSAAMRSMQNYHMQLDWGDIGYNFCIGGDGKVYEGRGWTTLGIHTGKANRYSIGICLIGDFRETLPPQVQLNATKALIKAGVKGGYIKPNYKLIAHKQVMATECPGTALFNEISKWKHFSPNGFEMSTIKHDYKA